MKIVFDDTRSILKELVGLYMSLPDDLRTSSELIPASELIFEATEFINFLKDKMGLRPGKSVVNKVLDDPWSVHGNVTKTKGTQTALNVIPNRQNTIVNQIPPTRISLAQPKIIHTVTPDGRDTIKTVMPKSVDSSVGTHFLASPTIMSVNGGPRTVTTTNASGPQKPITIMAKDPNTGIMKPVTLYPKNTFTNAAGVTTIQLGPNPSNIRLASTASSGLTAVGSAGKPIVIGAGGVRMPVMVRAPGVAGPKVAAVEEHGVICKEGCTCPLMNGATINEKMQNKLWMYLKSCLKIQPKDAETLLTYSWIQEDIFMNLLLNLPRVAFFKLCRVVNFALANNYSGEKKHCVLIKKRCKNLIDGMLFIKGQNYALPTVLVKMFREGYDTKPLSSLVLESLTDCEMTNDALMRKNYLCINPFHFGYETPAPATDPTQNHLCRKHMRLQSLASTLQPICKVCRKVQTEEDLTDGFFNVKKTSTGELTTTKAAASNSVKVKTEVVEKETNEEVSIEELDRDFQGMLDSIEDQVKDELEEVLDIQEDEEDNKANLRLDVGPAANANKRPLEDSTNQTPVAKKLKTYVREKRPSNANFQCWQCLSWFVEKVELKTHSCLNSLKITGGHIFTCHFCATCSDDLEKLRPHVQQCKKFNLAPLKCFMKFESVITSTFGSAKESSRSTRAKKSDQPSKCASCGIVFPSKSELTLHNSKPKCKSVKCEKCDKNFANDRTLEKHACNSDDLNESSNADDTRVDQDIKVIKLDRNKINHQPVKCFECGNMLQSYELLKAHQTVLNHCGTCISPFKTTCELLRHTCPGHLSPKVDKRVRIKTEPGLSSDAASMSPVVVLKNISDSSIPAIVDDEDAPLGLSRKKSK